MNRSIGPGIAGRFRLLRMILLLLIPGSFGVLRLSAAAAEAFPNFTAEKAREYLTSVAEVSQSQASTAAEPCLIAARIQSKLGSQEKAERLARQAVEREPNRAEIHSFLADLCIRQDRMEEAARELRKALELDPKLVGGHRRLGLVLDRLGDREGARRSFETAIEMAPRDGAAELLLGRLLLDQGHAQESFVHLEKACKLDPESAGAFYALSQVQSRLGQSEAARETLAIFQKLKKKEKEALDADNASQDNEKTLRDLAASFHAETAVWFLKRQRDDLAEAHLRQAVRIAPEDPQGHENLAAFYLQTGAWPAAREVCRELVRRWPERVTYRVNLGTVLLQLKEYPLAIDELKRVLELEPKQPEALNNLVRFFLGTRRELAEALALCRQLVEVQAIAANYDLLGWALYANGRYEEARAATSKAVELDPNNRGYRERHERLKKLP